VEQVISGVRAVSERPALACVGLPCPSSPMGRRQSQGSEASPEAYMRLRESVAPSQFLRGVAIGGGCGQQ